MHEKALGILTRRLATVLHFERDNEGEIERSRALITEQQLAMAGWREEAKCLKAAIAVLGGST